MHLARVAALTIATGCTPAKEETPSPGPALAEAVVDKLQDARREQADVEAHALLSALQLHVVQTTTCPADVPALAAAKMIPRANRDPWNHDYVLECGDAGASAAVISLGPDGKRGTPDDIRVDTDDS